MGWAAIARFGGIGDDLIASSVLPGLKAKWGHVEVITKKPWSVVFENNPNIDKLTNKDDADIPVITPDDWQKWFRVRAKEYDFFRNLSHSCEFRHALFPAMTEFDYGETERRKRFAGSYLESVHDICEIGYDPIGPQFFPTDDELSAARETQEKIGRGPVVGWVCSGTRIDKVHPRAGIAVARMIRELGVTVALFGGWDRDRVIAQMIEDQVRQENHQYSGTIHGLATCMSLSEKQDIWPIRRGLTQLMQCDLVITPDTGPWWAVAMEPLPKILMVSHASDENIGKHAVNTAVLHADPERVKCWPCHRLHNDFSTCTFNHEKTGAACISDISVHTIVETARRMLDATPKFPSSVVQARPECLIESAAAE